MYKIFYFLLLSLLLMGCNKNDDDNPGNPIDQLPPATQTGEQTFGCLVNGEPFVPPSLGMNAPNAFYQFVDGAYTLGISARTGGGNQSRFIILEGLNINSLEVLQYNLQSESNGKFSGIYSFGGGNLSSQTLTTSDTLMGILNITKFDETNFIIAGTFSFTVIDNEGKEIKITEGRFDMNYTN